MSTVLHTGDQQARDWETGGQEAGALQPDDWEAEALAYLEAVERRVAAQVAALRSVPANMPVPQDVVALLSLAPGKLASRPLPARYLPRATAVCEQVQEMVDDLQRRRWELAGRIATVRAARRAGPAACTIDYDG
jgi:hypothetical protein